MPKDSKPLEKPFEQIGDKYSTPLQFKNVSIQGVFEEYMFRNKGGNSIGLSNAIVQEALRSYIKSDYLAKEIYRNVITSFMFAGAWFTKAVPQNVIYLDQEESDKEVELSRIEAMNMQREIRDKVKRRDPNDEFGEMFK